MLLRWDIEHPGQIKLMPAPIPTWDGVEYVDSHALPTFRTGEGVGPSGGGGNSGPGGGGGGGGGGVNITRAEGKDDEELRVEGTASSSTSVVVHSGGASGGDCPGSVIGSALVDSSDDRFRFEDKNLSSVPSTVCVKSSAGDVDSSPVDLN